MSDSDRLDKWLWCARICRSRSLAQQLIEAGRVRVNRVPAAKPASTVHAGDVLTIAHGPQVRVLRVRDCAARRGPAAAARLLYEEMAPAG